MATTNSTTNRDAPLVSIRVPRNLRSVWPYPNLQHFQKYVDLMLLSATNERVAYNKTFVYVPAGYVLLKYAFFAQRWKMSHKTCRSLFNVLAIAGWLKIRIVECKSISNRMVKAPLVTFSKIGYDNGEVAIRLHESTSVVQAVSLSESESYEKVGQRFGTINDNGSSGSQESFQVPFSSTGRESGEDSSREGDRVRCMDGISICESDSYEELPQYSGHTSEHSGDNGDDNGDDALIIYKKEEEEYIKKKNKKEKNPGLDELLQFAEVNNIVNFDVCGFWNYYQAEGWKDTRGRQIRNWKRILMHAYQDDKSKFHIRKPTSPSRPTATDKLARQNANLARDLAAYK